MSYNLEIPNEVRYKYKNKIYVAGYTNVIGVEKLAECKYTATSSKIEIKYGDYLHLLIDKRCIYEVDNKYNTNLGSIRIMVSEKDIFTDDKIDITKIRGTIRFLNDNGEPYLERAEFVNLPLFKDYSYFENNEFIVISVELNYLINIGIKYIYLISPYYEDKTTIPYEYCNTFGCGIVRQGDNPYSNWNNIQNNLAFKHYLYQSHIRKEK